MVKKLDKDSSSRIDEPLLSSTVKDSAQQIWQAGLGAFNKAQAEGSKAFEALAKEGVILQRKTQAAAKERLSDASSKMSSLATDISSKATGQWDKLEGIFEERVSKALSKLGVPSAKDVSALIARIDELNRTVQKLSVLSAAPRAAVKSAAKTAAPKTVKTAVKTSARSAAAKRAPARKRATPASPH